MIRFDCPTCGRGYALADALAGLPLLCKGCGQRLTPPEPQPDPEPEPLTPPPAKPKAAVPVAPPKPAVPPKQVTSDPSEPVRNTLPPVLSTQDSVPAPVPADHLPPLADEIAAEAKPVRAGGGSRPPVTRAEQGADASRPPRPPSAPAGRRVVGLAVDAVVVLSLLGAGVVAGEELAGRPAAALIDEARATGSPSMDLLLGAAVPVVFVLVYLWLGTRGWTVGGWLKRRAG